MATLRPPTGVTGPTLDVQVLEGLETYITTEKFLHTLEAASAEWIDLSDHQQQPHKDWDGSPVHNPEAQQQPASPSPQQCAPQDQPSTPQQPSNSSRGGFFGGWCRASSTVDTAAAGIPPGHSAVSTEAAASGTAAETDGSHSSSAESDTAMPAVVAATTTFELVEPQAPLTESLMQEPFVLVSADDAIEGMAYYIALYLSRAPEARYMEPKQLQAALRQTFTAIRRSRYRVIWDWGRCLYRWGAVSYSALQLYEHPWLVRAVVAGVWASSKMAFGILF